MGELTVRNIIMRVGDSSVKNDLHGGSMDIDAYQDEVD